MNLNTNIIDNSKNYKYTVCTACFNSEKTIREVHKSLENITFKNFEWIVINDYSSDNTKEILEDIVKNSKIDIKFFDLDSNHMVTFCYNLGVREARGEFFILLDHDDTFVPEVFDRFNFYWESIPDLDKDNLAGMMCTCVDQDGVLIGNAFPKSPCIDGFFEMIFDHGVRHEKLFCYKTQIMKQYNFPLVDRYVPESTVLWNISSKYKTLFFNESLRIYTKPIKENNNLSFLDTRDYPRGYRQNFKDLINLHSNKLYLRPRTLISFLFNYVLYSKLAGFGIKSIFIDMKPYLIRLIFILVYLPLSILASLRIKQT